MKIYYLNDTQHPMTIRLLGPAGKEWENTYVQLASCEGRMFDIPAPANHVPYVKTWGNVTLLSSVDPAVFAQQSSSQASQDV